MFISLNELRERWTDQAWVTFGNLDLTAYLTCSAAYLISKPAGKKPTKTNVRIIAGHQRAMRMWDEDKNGLPINGHWTPEHVYTPHQLSFVKIR